MTRFRPTVEALDDRTLPSAMIVSPRDAASGLPVGRMAHIAEESAPEDVAGQSDSVAKVQMQDFHFVAKMSKASPKLF